MAPLFGRCPQRERLSTFGRPCGTEVRADQLIVARGLAPTRSAAQRLIDHRAVRWLAPAGWAVPRKAGEDLPDDCNLEVTDDAELRYVSRGGLKLDAALACTGIDVAGRSALDIGQSTGGFTDVLLQRGASHVVGIDVGRGQLHPRLAADPRVACFEGINVRDLAKPEYTQPIHAQPTDTQPANMQPTAALSTYIRTRPVRGFDIVVADLSFISLTYALPVIAHELHADGDALLLVKPQFELQPKDIGKGGIVKSAAAYPRVEARIRDACAALALTVRDYFSSGLDGGDGNREFFAWARHSSATTP